jgi:hypothetical protein
MRKSDDSDLLRKIDSFPDGVSALNLELREMPDGETTLTASVEVNLKAFANISMAPHTFNNTIIGAIDSGFHEHLRDYVRTNVHLSHRTISCLLHMRGFPSPEHRSNRHCRWVLSNYDWLSVSTKRPSHRESSSRMLLNSDLYRNLVDAQPESSPVQCTSAAERCGPSPCCCMRSWLYHRRADVQGTRYQQLAVLS